MPHNATLLYPYQLRYLADGGRFETGMWSRQTVKTLTTTPEVVLDVPFATDELTHMVRIGKNGNYIRAGRHPSTFAPMLTGKNFQS